MRSREVLFILSYFVNGKPEINFSQKIQKPRRAETAGLLIALKNSSVMEQASNIVGSGKKHNTN